ncbi:hypothetical protein AGABI2DRAFT_205353 [Agaricus bisporus var. bisporus H97]|uniref:hypothetical protein n=1 Tax=Agaricus bisporus var. bisporus (strain H97 / ATCC MYA-4626 / FGSC 10389) TaxID=936046 RepID=UPI00029F5B38|nr:hypothetical protein AGABI2DRAFT_205353 [Agaricus bisporus var. bisporus H97]EKV46235.1 hypothetical protein AGABI2DRAFT_205353 [Agaricus bisporus var. bisporus H97]
MTRAADPGSSSSQHRSRHPTRRQRSPSHSPPRKRSRCQRSPSPHSPDNSRARGRKSFRASSTSPRSKPTPLSVCPTCLGRNPHAVAHCKATRRWDGLDSNRCTRTDKGHLKDPDGTILCTDWQKPRSCSDTSAGHAPKHQCSGCGDRDHGAQGCPRAQKA